MAKTTEMDWVPLESNPEVMTEFLHKLGVSNKWAIEDILALDPEYLKTVNEPVLAVIFLYPDSDKINKPSVTEDSVDNAKAVSDGVYHMQQSVPNACGTIALIHGVANNLEKIELKDGFLKKFLDETKGLSFEERGKHLLNSEGIMETHKVSAQQGQTEAPAENIPVYHHFVAFVHKNGSLYELDGRKTSPINHGSIKSTEFLGKAIEQCQNYMIRNPDELRFTIVALTAKGPSQF